MKKGVTRGCIMYIHEYLKLQASAGMYHTCLPSGNTVRWGAEGTEEGPPIQPSVSQSKQRARNSVGAHSSHDATAVHPRISIFKTRATDHRTTAVVAVAVVVYACLIFRNNIIIVLLYNNCIVHDV